MSATSPSPRPQSVRFAGVHGDELLADPVDRGFGQELLDDDDDRS